MKQMPKKVSEAVIKRLPRYYRYLGDLKSSNIHRISSGELSKMMGLTASQIRQDLNCFGGFGQQGYGYNVEYLHNEIANILGLNKELNLIMLGAGNLGKAIANYANFEKRGFKVAAIFDVDESLIGKTVKSTEIFHINKLKAFLDNNNIDIVVLTMPAVAVKDVIDIVVAANIKGIWNFSYLDLKVPSHIAMVNVHLSDSLMTLAYKISEIEKLKDK